MLVSGLLSGSPFTVPTFLPPPSNNTPATKGVALEVPKIVLASSFSFPAAMENITLLASEALTTALSNVVDTPPRRQ